MWTRLGVALVLGTSILSVACGGSPTSPSPVTLTGTWVGGNFFRVCAGSTCQPTGTTTLQLTQSGDSLTGTWTSDQGSLGPGPSGTVTGSVTGSNVSMLFALGVTTPDCSFPVRVTATLNAARTQMTGSYATVSCSLLLAGDISLAKQ